MKFALWFCTALFLVMLIAPSFATEDCHNPHNQCGHNEGEGDETNITTTGGNGGEGGDGGSADSRSDSVANAAGGSSAVQVKNESSSLVFSGARDTAECFTKVTIGAEGFGIGFSKKDKWCRAVRTIARQLGNQNWKAAARLECRLPEWIEIYGKNNDDCLSEVYSGPGEFFKAAPPPKPMGSVVVPEAEYHQLLLAQQQTEEFEEQQQMVVDKFAQYDNLIEEREQEHADDDAEIERLKRKLAEQQEKDDALAAKRAAVRERYAKKEEAKELDDET